MKTIIESYSIDFGYIVLILSMFILLACGDKNISKHRILIVTGGHKFEREAFFNIFDSFSDIEYDEVVQPEANQLYSSQSIDEFDVLLFYDMSQEISDEQKSSFIKMLEIGKGIIFLHHSLVSYQRWDEFENIIGGRYYLESDKDKNREIVPSTYKHDVNIQVNISDKSHPVTKGLNNFVIYDEVYGKFKVLPTVLPLLSTTHPESGEIIGWTNIYGNSRIVYIQLGHDHNSYDDPNYRRLIKQSIEWVTGE